jgi:hypothetical protein
LYQSRTQNFAAFSLRLQIPVPRTNAKDGLEKLVLADLPRDL